MDCFAEPVIGRAFARPVARNDGSMIGSLKIESVAAAQAQALAQARVEFSPRRRTGSQRVIAVAVKRVGAQIGKELVDLM
jgi:hypothetical protein